MNEGTILRSSEWEDRVAQIVDQYESQWRDLLEKITPPDAVSYVSSVDLPPENDPEQAVQFREELRKALASVDADYRRRILERAQPTTHNAALDETVKPQSPPPAGDSPAEPDRKPLTVFGEGTEPTATFAPDRTDGDGRDVFTKPKVIGPTRSFQGDETDKKSKAESQDRAAADPALPDIPGYRIEGILGRGGMGIVYRAWQIGLNRPVALKMILDKRQADEAALARFQAEAEAVAKLDHENIVKIYDIGTVEGLPYFSLEFVEGRSLNEEWDAQPLPPARCVEIVTTLARAMERAHRAGIVHRDLKPANVLVRNDGVLKVTDFGLVKRIEDDSGQTQAGTVMGTPSYMAPEQAWGRTDVGPSADVYALGSILYALLTGRPPFQGPNAVETLVQLRSDEPIPPSRLQPKIPRDLETICLKAIHKDPARRYGSAEELAEDLRRFQAGEPIQARPVGWPERTLRWCRRKPVAAIALFLGFCLAVGGPAAAVVINDQKNKAETAQELAEENEAKAIKNETAAKEARKSAETSAILAGEQRSLALTVLNTIIERVPSDLKNVPGTQAFKSKVLRIAMIGLNRVANTGDPHFRDFVLARAHAKTGEGLLTIGRAKEAHDQFERSHAILVRLSRTETKTPQSTHYLRLGRSYRNLGYSTERLKGVQAAEEFHRQALEARRKALKGAKDPLFVKQEIAESAGKLGELLLAQGRTEEALKYIQESVKYRGEKLKKTPKDAKARREQAGAILSMGHASNSLGRPKQAADHFRKAISVLKPLADGPLADGGSFAGKANWAIGHIYLANSQLYAGDAKSALPNFRIAADRLEQLHNASPRNATLKRKLAQALYGHGVAVVETKQDDARQSFERCRQIRQALADAAPSDVGFQQALMFPLARLGKVEQAAAIAESLRTKLPDDAGNLYFVACCYALCAEAQRKTPVVARRPGMKGSPKKQGKPPRAAAEFQRLAIQSLRSAVAKGYKSKLLMRADPDLAPLRKNREFQKIINGL